MYKAKNIVVLGSTGSIGVSTLDVIASHGDQYSCYALVANQSVDILFQQVCKFNPRYAVLINSEAAKSLEQKISETTGIDLQTTVLTGMDTCCQLVAESEVEIVMAAIVGGAGLKPTLSAVNAGKKVLLANKEALVMGGQLFIDAVLESGASLLPVDSEHNAIFQAMGESNYSLSGLSTSIDYGSLEGGGELRRIILTGSGGPFRDFPLDKLESVTPEQAVKHPNWSMGKKISVDSATMMNKGLELIEACWLFGCSESFIDILIHPQSVVHSMVEFVDGSTIAQLGQPDMRTPIANVLSFPKRIKANVESLDWSAISSLSFAAPDYNRFKSLALARDVAQERGSTSTVMNAANEVAVDAFLFGRVGFTDIVQLVDRMLNDFACEQVDSIDAVLSIDRAVRERTTQVIDSLSS